MSEKQSTESKRKLRNVYISPLLSPGLSPIFGVNNKKHMKRSGFVSFNNANINESFQSIGRPTRTPKPTNHNSFNTSHFLDRSFCRQELLFEEQDDCDDNNNGFSIIPSEKTGESAQSENDNENENNDNNNGSDSEYDYECYLNDERKEKEKGNEIDLTTQIENLSIIANTNNQSKNEKAKTKTEKKVFSVRVTRSNRMFVRYHSFGDLLMDPSECGSGCPLYKSKWKKKTNTITKLMPLLCNLEFTKKENIDNAVREFEFHCEIHRAACKQYGLQDSPCVAVLACVDIKYEHEPYLAIVMPRLQCNLSEIGRVLNENECMLLLQTGIRFLCICDDLNIVHNDIKPENIFIEFDNKNENINKFVFGDFGCTASLNEEFPFGELTGTLTMWDMEALGSKHGKENGFSKENDLYGFLGSLLDAIYGKSIVEELLNKKSNMEWVNYEWKEFTDLMRKDVRKRIQTDSFMETLINSNKLNNRIIENDILITAIKQIGKNRKQRMNLKQFKKLCKM